MTLFGSRLKPILDEKASSLRNGVERGLREDSVKAVTAVRGDRGRHSRRGPGFLVVQSRETEKGQQFPGFLPDMAIQGIPEQGDFWVFSLPIFILALGELRH
jgi:hypothetical protein